MKYLRSLLIVGLALLALAACDTVSPANPTPATVPNATAPAGTDGSTTPYPAPLDTGGEATAYPAP